MIVAVWITAVHEWVQGLWYIICLVSLLANINNKYWRINTCHYLYIMTCTYYMSLIKDVTFIHFFPGQPSRQTCSGGRRRKQRPFLLEHRWKMMIQEATMEFVSKLTTHLYNCELVIVQCVIFSCNLSLPGWCIKVKQRESPKNKRQRVTGVHDCERPRNRCVNFWFFIQMLFICKYQCITAWNKQLYLFISLTVITCIKN